MQTYRITAGSWAGSWPCEAAFKVQSSEPAAGADAADSASQPSVRCYAAVEGVDKSSRATGHGAAADIGPPELDSPVGWTTRCSDQISLQRSEYLID